MLFWFGYSFAPLKWQSSFKEFESLYDKADSKEIIYDAKLYEENWINSASEIKFYTEDNIKK
ncbi:hypothetical protein [Campylobacter volucris]|uniref:hypothetical protein n=1 Tax=Campylobacter volucris TaxID=1031542 RepID=UPI001E55BCCA|nr:hypothetical protein [Campylobacter volucris]